MRKAETRRTTRKTETSKAETSIQNRTDASDRDLARRDNANIIASDTINSNLLNFTENSNNISKSSQQYNAFNSMNVTNLYTSEINPHLISAYQTTTDEYDPGLSPEEAAEIITVSARFNITKLIFKYKFRVTSTANMMYLCLG